MKVRVPADVDMADRVLAGLTARQVAILGADALLLWMLWATLGQLVPAFVFAVVAVPFATLGFVWATVKVEGTSLERLAAAALQHVRVPRRRVLAPEGLAAVPEWAPGTADAVAPLDLPFDAPDAEGGISLGAEGHAVVCRATSINFALRSELEQGALVEAFGRMLNALDAPVQFLIHSERADLGALVDDLEARAAALPHPALGQAAREHAEFLRALGSRRDVLRRRALVCFRDPSGGDPGAATARLAHRVEEAESLLRGLGIGLRRLDEPEAARVLARAADPDARTSGLGAGVVGAAR